MDNFFNLVLCSFAQCKNYNSKVICHKCGRNRMLSIKDRYERGNSRESLRYSGLFAVSDCNCVDCKHISSQVYCSKCSRNTLLVIKDRYE